MLPTGNLNEAELVESKTCGGHYGFGVLSVPAFDLNGNLVRN